MKPETKTEDKSQADIRPLPAPMEPKQEIALLKHELKQAQDALAAKNRQAEATEKRYKDEIAALTVEIEALKKSPVTLALENAGNIEPMNKKFMELCSKVAESDQRVKGSLSVKIEVATGLSGHDDGALDTKVTYSTKMPAESEGAGRLYLEGDGLAEASAKQVDMFQKRRGQKKGADDEAK